VSGHEATPTPPPVTVVVPVRDMAAELPACLTALTRQSYPSYEVLVVDNGSRDESREVAGRFPVTLLEETRPGAAAARNCGIRAASHGVIAFTDADCIPARSWLRNLVAPFQDPEVTVVAGGLMPHQDGPSLIASYSATIGQYSAEVTLSHPRFPYAPTGCTAVRRDVLFAAGLFDPDFLTYEGADLFYRINRLGLLRSSVAARAMVFYRTRPDFRAFVRQNYRYGQGYGRFCHKFADEFEPGALRLPALVSRWHRRVLMGIAKLREAPGGTGNRLRLIRLHIARENAQLQGMLRWQDLRAPAVVGKPS